LNGGPAPAFVITVPARPENVGLVRQALTGVCDALTADPKATADVRLAATEACTNVVVHAYDGAVAGALEVEARPDGNSLEVLVRDRGAGFAPHSPARGLGLGLPLIMALAESVNVSAGPDGLGTEIVMRFALDDAGLEA
jgi:anti-sigma regulatory factor (Ser/Thr protein kinase)